MNENNERKTQNVKSDRLGIIISTPRSVAEISELMLEVEERAQKEGLRREPSIVKISESIRKLIDSKMPEDQAFYNDGSRVMSGSLDIDSDIIRLRTTKTPASASDSGYAGEICWDSNFLYLCIATDTWRRIAHSTW